MDYRPPRRGVTAHRPGPSHSPRRKPRPSDGVVRLGPCLLRQNRRPDPHQLASPEGELHHGRHLHLAGPTDAPRLETPRSRPTSALCTPAPTPQRSTPPSAPSTPMGPQSSAASPRLTAPSPTGPPHQPGRSHRDSSAQHAAAADVRSPLRTRSAVAAAPAVLAVNRQRVPGSGSMLLVGRRTRAVSCRCGATRP